MIRKSEPLSMAESLEFVDKDSNPEMVAFMKKFTKLNSKEGKEFRKKLEDLNILKMNERHISKVIDIMPKSNEEVNKIFIDTSLDEDETRKIIDTVKEFE